MFDDTISISEFSLLVDESINSLQLCYLVRWLFQWVKVNEVSFGMLVAPAAIMVLFFEKKRELMALK